MVDLVDELARLQAALLEHGLDRIDALLDRRDAPSRGSVRLGHGWRIPSTWISRWTSSGAAPGAKPRPNWLRWIVVSKSPPQTSRLSWPFS